MEVIEFYTEEYRNAKTGQRVHAPFPEGYQDEVNYDGSVKAFAFLLGNECNVSHDKVRLFLSELTGAELEISKGMINGLCAEFSAKTEAEQKEIYNTLLSSPVMNIDFTNANVNGKSAQVLICAAPDTAAALFIAREKKGHEGIKDTPVEVYQGILVHDHDRTFYAYGLNHQECMQHNSRYLKGSEENEPELIWNQEMHPLVREMLHYRNGLGDDEALDAQKVGEFEERYDRILKKAEEEYEASPPSDYYREGYNLYMRLVKYKQNELLFLHDKRVPSNNSLCERLARVYKRKQKQVMVMRSFENLKSLCNSMSVIYLLRNTEDNLYQKASSIFGRKRPPKEKMITGAL
jgi:Transposase IS66 family